MHGLNWTLHKPRFVLPISLLPAPLEMLDSAEHAVPAQSEEKDWRFEYCTGAAKGISTRPFMQ